MSDPKVLVRKGESGVVNTAMGPRSPTPVPDYQPLLNPSAELGVKRPPRMEEPKTAPSAFKPVGKTEKGGRRRRHRGGRKTRRRHRRHRGGGEMSVVQKGDRWYIRETTGSVSEDSEKNWATKEEAEAMVRSLQKIKDATPDQEERKAIAVAASGLANMKTRGGRSRRH